MSDLVLIAKSQKQHQMVTASRQVPACHAKRLWMSPSATPATQKTAASPATSVDQACHKCHACHAKAKSMSPSATPATLNVSGCHQVPRLPRKRQRPHRRQAWTKRVTRASPATQVPRLPRKSKVITKCHACQAKCAWMSPSATPATQQTAASPATSAHKARHSHKSQPSATSATLAMQKQSQCHQVPRLPRVSELCVRELCVSKLCVNKFCVCEQVVRGRRREAGGADGSAQPKTRTPQQDVGKTSSILFFTLYFLYFVFLHNFVVTFISCNLTGTYIYIYI